MLSAVIDSGHAVAPSSWRRYLAIVLQGLCAEPHRPSHWQPHPYRRSRWTRCSGAPGSCVKAEASSYRPPCGALVESPLTDSNDDPSLTWRWSSRSVRIDFGRKRLARIWLPLRCHRVRLSATTQGPIWLGACISTEYGGTRVRIRARCGTGPHGRRRGSPRRRSASRSAGSSTSRSSRRCRRARRCAGRRSGRARRSAGSAPAVRA
jgi:hypothetical protein